MRRLIALLACSAVAALPAAPAFADADPASNVLLTQDVYFPYAPNQPNKPLQTALTDVLAQSKKQGYQLRVAIIAVRSDLGAVPQYFDDPQKYADLLTKEISFGKVKPPVLVVLPGGFGGNNLGDAAGDALSDLSVEGKTGDELAVAAIKASVALAKANGKSVTAPKDFEKLAQARSADDGGGGVSPILIFGGPVLLVAAAALIAASRNKDEDDDEEEA